MVKRRQIRSDAELARKVEVTRLISEACVSELTYWGYTTKVRKSRISESLYLYATMQTFSFQLRISLHRKKTRFHTVASLEDALRYIRRIMRKRHGPSKDGK